jgi:Zinc metalloprotease (elastase)
VGNRKLRCGLLMFLFFVCSNSFASSGEEDRFQKFQEFRKKYGEEWISLWERGKPKLIFGGKFSSQNPSPVRPQIRYKEFKKSSVEREFSPFSVTSKNEKLVIIEFPAYMAFSPNEDGIMDRAEFVFQQVVSATDACGHQGKAPHRCFLMWSLEIEDCNGRGCEVKRKFEGSQNVQFSPGQENAMVPVTVVWDGRDEGGEMVKEGVYFWRFDVRYVRETEICYKGCVCNEKKEECFDECFLREKEVGRAGVSWDIVLDITPPRIEFLGPEGISEERGRILIGYEDNLGGVSRESFYVEMNGEEVSGRFEVGDKEAKWDFYEMEEGDKYIRFWISDIAGNVGMGEGRFKVISDETIKNVGVAREFLLSLKEVYGFRDDLGDVEVDWEMTEKREKEIGEGEEALRIETTFVKFVQRYEGVPVVGGNLSVIVDEEGRARGVYGKYFPSIQVSVRPAISSEEVKRIAREVLVAEEIFGEPELWILPFEVSRGLEYRLSWLVKGRFYVSDYALMYYELRWGRILTKTEERPICRCFTSPCPCDPYLRTLGVFIDAMEGRILSTINLEANSNLFYAPAKGYVFPNDWTSDNQQTSVKDLPGVIDGLYFEYQCGSSMILNLSCCLFSFFLCPLFCWESKPQICITILPLNPEKVLIGDMGNGVTVEVKTYMGSATAVARGDENWFYSYPYTGLFEIYYDLTQEKNKIEAGFREVNVYYHLMKAWDMVRSYGVKITAPIIVEATQYPAIDFLPRWIFSCDAGARLRENGYKMAFLNGNVRSCIPAAWSGDMVYHEFGHIILFNYRFYPFYSDIVLGSFHEGVADYITSLVDSNINNLDPIVGEGFRCQENSCAEPNYIRNLNQNVRQVSGGREIINCDVRENYYVCRVIPFAEPHEYGISIGGALFRSLYHFVEKANSMGKGKLVPYILFNKAFFDTLYHMAGENMVTSMDNFGEFIANLISVVSSQSWGNFENLKEIFSEILAMISVNQFITIDLDAVSDGIISTIVVKKPYVGVGRWESSPPNHFVAMETNFVFSSPPTLVGFLGTITEGATQDLRWRVRLATSPDLFSEAGGRNGNNYFATDWFSAEMSYPINFDPYYSSPRNITYYFFEYRIPEDVFDRFSSSVPSGQNVRIYVLVEVDYGGGETRDSVIRLGEREIYYYFEAPGKGAPTGGGGGGGGGCSSFYPDLVIALIIIFYYYYSAAIIMRFRKSGRKGF